MTCLRTGKPAFLQLFGEGNFQNIVHWEELHVFFIIVSGQCLEMWVCEYKLQSLSMQNMSLLLAEQKTCSHVMLWPSSLLKRILLLSFVDLCTPVLIQKKMRLESGGQNYSGLMPKSKEHDMGGAQGSTFWWNLFFFPIYIYEHFILLQKKKKKLCKLACKENRPSIWLSWTICTTLRSPLKVFRMCWIDTVDPTIALLLCQGRCEAVLA